MTTETRLITGQEWVVLSERSRPERVQAMAAQFRAMCRLPEQQRHEQIRHLVDTVYEHPDNKIREMTQSRLLAWLELEPDDARTISESYERVWEETPADVALKQVIMVRSAIMDLPPLERQRARELVQTAFENLLEPVAAETPSDTTNPDRTSRHWWELWRHD
jgi:hypothetical protein